MGVQASSVGGDRAARCRAHKRVLSGLEFQPVETGQSGLHPASKSTLWCLAGSLGHLRNAAANSPRRGARDLIVGRQAKQTFPQLSPEQSEYR